MYRAYYHVDNPSDYLKISIYIVILDHFSGRGIKVSSKQQGAYLFCVHLI